MAGTSILRSILENCPTAKISASRHNTEPIIKHSQIEYVQGDLRSVEECRRMARGCNCAVMAAAHAGGVGFTREFPWEHMKENLLMNMQMLEAFRLENVKRIIFIGSAALYQEFEGSIKEEDLDLNKEPHEAYFGFAWGMRFLEKLCQFLHSKYETEIVIVRAANIFGPYDKFNPQVSNFIPAIIRKAVDKMEPFEVWGSPDVTRDVIYADDFGRAIGKMINNDKIKFDIFNIGSGTKTTVGNVVEWALKYARHTPKEIKYVQNKPMTIRFRALDCTKAEKVLGWRPQYSIEEGVRKTVEWWVENKDKWKK
jgi:GDP-L-fucose synthase